MLLAVVAYPRLDDEDRQWVESIRARFDPQVARLAAHFTLVFPVEASLSTVAGEVSAVAESMTPIAFTIRHAMAVRNVRTTGGHVFLVADEGGRAIEGLHGRLYAGALKPHRRADIPYVPHMTVAASEDFGWCDALARNLCKGRTISGTLDSIDVVDVALPRVESFGQFTLARSGLRATGS
jgi:2'-5' RNA ligase